MNEPRDRLIELLEEAVRVAGLDAELAPAQMVLCVLCGSLAGGSLEALMWHVEPFARQQVAMLRRRLEETET